MLSKVLKVVNREMQALDLQYFYMVNDSDKVTYPYITGEYNESGYSFENEMANGQLLLEAWTRGTFSDLIMVAEKIKNHFAEYQTIEDNVAMNITFNSFNNQLTDDIELKKIEIYLDIVYWKGIN